MVLFVILIMGGIIGFVLSLKIKLLWIKSIIICLTETFFIAFIFLLLTGNVKYAIGDTFKNNRESVAKSAENIRNKSIAAVKIKWQVLLDAPILKQYPELPRGCEVTSLAMLLQYKGIQVGKMELAEKIKKDTTPLVRRNGTLFWGNPNEGFIGSMYDLNKPGYGVYHKPIKELAEQYLPGKIVDLTGRSFTELQKYLSLDIPVWVITNTTFQKLPELAFETWDTPQGKVQITYKEHAVLITGYDSYNIYFNDPLSGTKNGAVNKQDFLEAWLQMGSQAVTYLP